MKKKRLDMHKEKILVVDDDKDIRRILVLDTNSVSVHVHNIYQLSNI